MSNLKDWWWTGIGPMNTAGPPVWVAESAVAVIEPNAPAARPASHRLTPLPADAKHDEYLREYDELAALVGVTSPDRAVESFKQFLLRHDLPVFALSAVVEYMDGKAERESKDKAGWHWCPLRERDQLPGYRFGRASEWISAGTFSSSILKPASDFYDGGVADYKSAMRIWNTLNTQSWSPPPKGPSAQPYDKTIPLHALRRIALIEREHTQRVAFFVCDYATAPAVPPDPFLMCAVPNPRLAQGEGRFVLDFWEEPSFGIEAMIKSD